MKTKKEKEIYWSDISERVVNKMIERGFTDTGINRGLFLHAIIPSLPVQPTDRMPIVRRVHKLLNNINL